MRRTALLAAAAMGALVIRRYATLRKSMKAVAPELRTPLLAVSGIPFNALTLPVIRFAMTQKTRLETGVTRERLRVDGADIDALVLTPADRPTPRPAVLWLHGGGMVAGTPQFEARWAARLVTALGAVAVLPDYRLAPENPFPAALDDCMATLQWMVNHADELGIDPGRIAVCGPSAGGGLSAAIAQRAIDEGISVRAQGLIYPMLDDRTALRTDLVGRGELTWSARSNRWGWTAYLGREPRLAEAPEYAAPARREDVAGLPPAWIGVGELDVLHDENVAYAEKLKAAGVACKLVTVPGMYHGADGIVDKASSTKEFHASLLEFLRAHLDVAA